MITLRQSGRGSLQPDGDRVFSGVVIVFCARGSEMRTRPGRQPKERQKPRGRMTPDLFDDGPRLDEAMMEAFREACLRHKRAGVPLVVWRDGKIVEIPPEEIEIP